MAVAVKNPPLVGSSSPFESVQVVSLLGAAYAVVCLGLVIDGLPYLWRTLTGLTDIGGNILLGLIMLAAIVGLAVLGVRLFGKNRPAGARAGVFLGFVGFLVVLLLTRWVSLWLQYWIDVNGWLGNSPTVGLALTAGAGVVFLAAEIYLFFRPQTEPFLIRLESQGWFSAASYKGQQGQRVRRGTILGILLVAGSGVYTMTNNGFLHRMPSELWLNVPFTGTAPVVDPGDADAFLKGLDPKDKTSVQIVDPGASSYKEGQVVSAEEFRTALKARIQADESLNAQAQERLIQDLVDPKKTDITDLLSLPGSSAAAVAAFGPTALGTLPPSRLPTALLRLDPYALRKVNANLRAQYVRVSAPKDAATLKTWQNLTDLTVGSVVTKAQFDEGTKGHPDDEKPIAEPPFAAASPGPVNDRLTLLPALQYTLPLLLIALALWGAWRIVNYPGFADFLIATEAELNKVSWTTRPRLIQDTIVVLVTTLLLALFLFLMDQTWRIVLSWKPIGVLQIDNEKTDKSAEQKMW
jgi:preprotein translocase SecE subunit